MVQQTEKLRLDYQSTWSLPFKMQFQSDDKSSENTGRRTAKGKGKKDPRKMKKGKTVGNISGAGLVGAVKTQEDIDQELLEKIELERR